MKWGEDVHTAIQRGDAVALRFMAKKELKPQARMFLTLLADILDRFEKDAPLKKTA
jgi:hypothetical protein